MKTYNSIQIKASLQQWYNVGSESDELWYTKARWLLQDIAASFDIDVHHACNLCAILSPRNAWHANVSDVVTVLTGVGNNISPEYIRVHTFDNHKYKAIVYVMDCIGEGSDATRYVTGQKVSAFAAALRGDYNSVVVDTWMIAASGLNPKTEFVHRNGLYNIIANCIKEIASELYLEPALVQARIWCSIRRHYGYPETF